MNQSVTIHHDLGDVIVKPSGKVNQARLKKMICHTLDQYLVAERVPANAVHQAAKNRHGDNYQTPGYYLRLYRLRADMTQTELAAAAGLRQHHLSEMERNKRSIGKATANKLARQLGCDYRRLL